MKTLEGKEANNKQRRTGEGVEGVRNRRHSESRERGCDDEEKEGTDASDATR